MRIFSFLDFSSIEGGCLRFLFLKFFPSSSLFHRLSAPSPSFNASFIVFSRRWPASTLKRFQSLLSPSECSPPPFPPPTVDAKDFFYDSTRISCAIVACFFSSPPFSFATEPPRFFCHIFFSDFGPPAFFLRGFRQDCLSRDSNV